MICKLTNKLVYEEDSIENNTGKLIPKDGKTYRVLLRTDNPDIISLTTELRLIRQALEEYNRRMIYGVKVYLNYPEEETDVFIDFIEPDSHMTNNTLAYAGYPFGSLRGKIKVNNRFIWLDGYNKFGYELRDMGITIPNMVDSVSYKTYNIRQTIKHEFGHILGLEHSQDEEASMRAYYNKRNIMLKKTSLDQLDLKYGLRSVSSRWMKYIVSSIQRRIYK